MNNEDLLKTDSSSEPMNIQMIDMNQPYVTETEQRTNPDGTQSVIQRTYTKEAFLMKMVNDADLAEAKMMQDSQHLNQLESVIDKDNETNLAIEQMKLAQEQAKVAAVMAQQQMMQQACAMMMMQQQQQMMMLNYQNQQQMLPPISNVQPQTRLLIGEEIQQNQIPNRPIIEHGISEDVEYTVVDDNGLQQPNYPQQNQFTPQQQKPINNSPYDGINFSDIESGL